MDILNDCDYNYRVWKPRILVDRRCVVRRTPQRGGIPVHTRTDGCVWCYTPSWWTVSPCRRGCSVGSSRPSATARQSAARDMERIRWPSLMCSDVPPPCQGDTDHTAGAQRSRGHGAGTWGFRGKPRRRTWQRTVRERMRFRFSEVQ